LIKTILHTEASLGFGGQEIRILKESLGMRKKGYNIIIAASPGAKILDVMAKEGFKVYSVPFKKKKLFSTLVKLRKIIKDEKVDLVNTHSSLDSWIAGIAARLYGVFVIRTRHLSTAIKKGLNSYILYNKLADYVITTCQEIVPMIVNQSRIDEKHCQCIATGIDPADVKILPEEKASLRQKYGINEGDLVIGTLCVLRSWKGISDILKAASMMKDRPHIKWLIVGDGPSEEKFKKEANDLLLGENVIFTGYLTPPFAAIDIMDVFVLLSTSNEGISQATLQASYLEKPLITTPTGGLKEVCIHKETGFIVPKNSPQDVMKAVENLENDQLRQSMGKNAKRIVLEKFTLEKTIDRTIEVYESLIR
jgi:glycosyltransferase involved in cell wall biosynthesis